VEGLVERVNIALSLSLLALMALCGIQAAPGDRKATMPQVGGNSQSRCKASKTSR
jgi:hypothetical protein